MIIELPNTISLEALSRFAQEQGCELKYPTIGFFRMEPRKPPVSAATTSRSATLPSRSSTGLFIPAA